VVAAFTQVDDEVEIERAAGTQEQRRLGRGESRAVRSDEHVGGQVFAFALAQRAKAGRSGFLAGLHQPLHVEAQSAARGHDLAQRCNVDAVLALVVRGAAPVPAIAVHGHGPGRSPRAPLRIVAKHDVAVAVHEDGRERVVLVTIGKQEWAGAGDRIVDDAKPETLLGERGADFIREVAPQIGEGVLALAVGVVRHPPPQIGEQMAVIEPALCGGYGVLPGRHAPMLQQPKISENRGQTTFSII
jgi:hypothetical protein